MTKNWDWSEADKSFKRALALEPQNVRTLRMAAALATSVGRFDEALVLSRRAQQMRPTDATIYYNLSLLQRKAGDLDGALLNGRRVLELEPRMPDGHLQLGLAYLLKGMTEDALREVEQESVEGSKARGLAVVFYTVGRVQLSDENLQLLITRYRDQLPREIAQVYAWRNEKDEAFQWLDRAFAQRDVGLAELKGDPLFRNLWTDPRWATFLTGRLKLPS
jgi:tetratricopeptide (TPR) repeat protein